MSSWEYKLISSGPLGFASMQLLEQHLGQLGKDEWEIISFSSKPENPLVFHGLARRPIARDWFPPAEAKPAYTPPPIPKEEEDDGRDERSFADELPPARAANAPATADLGLGSFDDLGGSEEDLPTLFEALRPFLRKNPRGDQSVELDFLAKKFEQDARELLTAFEECGLQTPAQPEEKGEVVDHDGSLFWIERDKRGRLWVNTREKKFKTAKTTPVPAEARTELSSDPVVGGALRPEASRHSSVAKAREDTKAAPSRDTSSRDHRPEAGGPESKSYLGRIRAMMRRNRRGHGWSGSFPYLTKALKLDEAQLLGELAQHGLKLPVEGEPKPALAPDGDFLFWLNKNQRGEIWINAELGQRGAGSAERGASSEEQGSSSAKATEDKAGSEERGAGSGERGAGEAKAGAVEGRTERAYVDPRAGIGESKSLPPENTLTAVRLLMQPKKRGEGVTAPVHDLARQLEKSDAQMLAALADAGLHVPESPKAKPTFAGHGGEVFWLNVNAKGQVWLNAKVSAAKKSRAKEASD